MTRSGYIDEVRVGDKVIYDNQEYVAFCLPRFDNDYHWTLGAVNFWEVRNVPEGESLQICNAIDMSVVDRYNFKVENLKTYYFKYGIDDGIDIMLKVKAENLNQAREKISHFHEEHGMSIGGERHKEHRWSLIETNTPQD